MLTLINSDCLAALRAMPADSVQCCVTSPPYFGLRDYGNAAQIGLEETPAAYVAKLVEVFAEVRRVLKPDGTLWLNLGDSYAGSGRGMGDVCSTNKGNGASRGCGSQKPAGLHENARTAAQVGRAWVKPPAGLKNKDLIGIPWRVAFALQEDGWWLRQDIIWHKPNPMPESVTDRCTKAHEYFFLLSKSARYYFDGPAIAEPSVCGDGNSHFDKGKTAAHLSGRAQAGPRVDDGMRNKRSVWSVSPAQYREAHFATFPPDLIKPCILAGTRHGDAVLDPFGGSGTTGAVAIELGRLAVLIELNPEYCALIRQRCAITPGLALSA